MSSNAPVPDPRSPVPPASRPGAAPALRAPVFALVAGEASGDQLGADLIAALRARFPGAHFVGVGGARMGEAGFEAWHDIDALSVMGFAEVIRHLPRLLILRRELTGKLLALRPDVFIGIDAPDFNLGLEQKLKRAGIHTVHYVSPSVWAWRERRAEKIGRSADRVLCLFPMEPPIYARHGIDARFVGHPLATRFPMISDRNAARDALGLARTEPVLAVLPGSRPAEIQRLGRTFLDAAKRVRQRVPGLQVVIPAANKRCETLLHEMDSGLDDITTAPRGGGRDAARWNRKDMASPGASGPSPESPVPSPDGEAISGARIPRPAGEPASERPVANLALLTGQAHLAMQAADVVLLASGTATLEAMLAKRPMVVGYRVAPTSYRIARLLRMLKTDVYSLPNILARADDPDAKRPVPELMQDDCTASNLAGAVVDLFTHPDRRAGIMATFEHLHQNLLGDSRPDEPAGPAADAIAECVSPG